MKRRPTVALCALAASVLLWLSAPAVAEDAWSQALARRDVATLARLVGNGADVNRRDEAGYTALMIAAGHGGPDLVRELLERGARVNAANGRGGTALMYAAAAGDVAAVEILLAHGAGVNAGAANGWTPLMLATARGFEGVVRRLLEHDADPNLADIYGWTPLMRAIDLERPRIARVLLDSSRTDPDVRNENGHTALHLAAGRGKAALARLLLARGAYAWARDRHGRTPAQVARLQGHGEIAKMLQPPGR